MESKKPYAKLFRMISLSLLGMYAVSYLNCDESNDFRWSETRLYMSLMMGSLMMIIMLFSMRNMYKNLKVNSLIYVGSIAVFFSSLILVRSQALIHDIAYMKGMIPHHSIAILTSEHANIQDQRVRELADHIADTQRKEIKEMTWLVNDIQTNGLARNTEEAVQRKVPIFSGKPLGSGDNLGN